MIIKIFFPIPARKILLQRIIQRYEVIDSEMDDLTAKELWFSLLVGEVSERSEKSVYEVSGDNKP